MVKTFRICFTLFRAQGCFNHWRAIGNFMWLPL